MAVAAMFPALASVVGAGGATAAGLSMAQVAMTGLSIAGSVAGAIEATRQAKKANAAILAQQNYANYQQSEQSRQVTQQSQMQMGRVAQQALAERGRLVVESSEAGVSGSIIDRLNNQIAINEQQAFQDIRETAWTEQLNLYNRGYARTAAAQQQVNANAKAARSAWIQSGLKIAGAALSLEAAGKTADTAKKTVAAAGQAAGSVKLDSLQDEFKPDYSLAAGMAPSEGLKIGDQGRTVDLRGPQEPVGLFDFNPADFRLGESSRRKTSANLAEFDYSLYGG